MNLKIYILHKSNFWHWLQTYFWDFLKIGAVGNRNFYQVWIFRHERRYIHAAMFFKICVLCNFWFWLRIFHPEFYTLIFKLPLKLFLFMKNNSFKTNIQLLKFIYVTFDSVLCSKMRFTGLAAVRFRVQWRNSRLLNRFWKRIYLLSILKI